jgi:hypothetical protein
VPLCPLVSATAIRAVAAGGPCDRLRGAADRMTSMTSLTCGSLGLQEAAGLFILVASWLSSRATVLIGPE